jgi:GNAT superfamily N-acetyltransferase
MGVDYEIAVRQHRFDLLYANGALTGLIETLDQGERLLVVNVAVAPEAQGRGFGSQLMARAEDVAREAGCHRVWLYTNQRFEENVELYRRLGYAVDLEEDLGGGTVRVDMSKALAPAP